MKTKISDFAIYFIWAYQGVLMDDVNLDFEEPGLIVHLSIPNRSDLKDAKGKELSGTYLENLVKKVTTSLSMSFQLSQGINLIFETEIRDEWWHKEYAKNSIPEVLQRMIDEDPFETV